VGLRREAPLAERLGGDLLSQGEVAIAIEARIALPPLPVP
jgi:hypothetical protein